MSIQFSQGKLQSQERKTILQEVQHQMQREALEAIRGVATGGLAAEVTAKLGREKGQPREAKSQARAIDWQCGTCECTYATQFRRDATHPPGLRTCGGASPTH